MIRNYFTIAFRNLSSNKGYAIINMLGLAIGISVCLLIFLVIRFETSFDNFHKKKDHIYRVVSIFKTAEGIDYESGVPFPTGPALRHEYPRLKNVASILSVGGSGQVDIPDNQQDSRAQKRFKEESGVVYAEPEFFDIFDFKWLAGDKLTALKDPNTALLSRSLADKYFGNWQNAIGRSVILDNSITLKITGILNDMPANTDFTLKLVISYATLKNTGINGVLSNWAATFAQHYCFIVLPDHLSESRFNEDLESLVKKYKPVENQNEGMMLLPLKEMHFDTRWYNVFNQPRFSRSLIFALSLIGFFVLTIACVNFINLATAQAINRSKEVGIRKVLGSSRLQLLSRFLSESALLILFATVIAIGLCEGVLPFFNHLLDIKIDRYFISDPMVIEALILITAGTTLLAGFYPAVVISGFNPVTAFKNKSGVKYAGALSLRRVLVVLQFTISQALIISVLIIVDQMDYFRSAPLGFDKDAIVITHIPGDSAANAKVESLRSQLQQIPGIDKVSFSFGSPIDNNDWNSDITFNNVKKNEFGANLKWADADYPETYHLKLLAGHFYAKSDTVRNLVVNETFLKKLGIHDPKEVLGAKVGVSDKTGWITGVVKDFNVASLHDPMSPVIMGTWKGTYQTVNIRIESTKARAVLANIEKLWKENFPDQIYEYRFLDESIAANYKQEAELSVLYRIFAAIAIFISCLGLYSLASFMAVQRAKEVGIRKTLGASVSNILYLFSKEFTLLILIAFCISAPIAWYFMHQWLQNYAFHISPGPAVFVSAISASLVIAWLSVAYKAVGTALANPVESLRAE